jgi:hypothetical protein
VRRALPIAALDLSPSPGLADESEGALSFLQAATLPLVEELSGKRHRKGDGEGVFERSLEGTHAHGIYEAPSLFERPGRARAWRVVALLSLGTLLLALSANPARAGSNANFAAGLPDREVLVRALAAYQRAEKVGLVRNHLLTVIDYGLPSSLRRLWVIEPQSMRVLMHEFVAHGRGSAPVEDPDRATRFGNEPESHRSSLGTFLTGETYLGEHGYSLELLGLEPGVNDRAQERHIVMHPAAYVSEAFRAMSGGRVGRSWGCPALDPAVAGSLIARIQAGSVVFAAGPNRRDDHPLFLRAAEHTVSLPGLDTDQGG